MRQNYLDRIATKNAMDAVVIKTGLLVVIIISLAHTAGCLLGC